MRSVDDRAADEAFFTADHTPGGEVLHPTPICVSGWGNRTIRGPVTCGALARATERAADAAGVQGFLPARFTADLFRPVALEPLTVVADVVRQGNRVVIVDAAMEQRGRPVARSTTLFVRPADKPDGTIWRPALPKLDTLPDDKLEQGGPRLFVGDDTGWAALAAIEPSAERKRAWVLPNVVVLGESITPFQFMASVSDVTNLVAHWGDRGVSFINADVTLNLMRLPRALECGLSVQARFEGDGISLGLAHLYDDEGVMGASSVVGLASERPGDPRTAGAAT